MNKIKNTFSINELENLSGIKAHTIRIWEKRYGILQPTRLNRNIRIYQLKDLQKLLNVGLLYNENYKISKIAKFTEHELQEEVKNISADNFSSKSQINALLISMYTFDVHLFEETYQQQIKTNSFSEIFINTYIPLLNHIGVLWQTNSLQPVNEHFISNLIYQKIVLQIALIENTKPSNDKIHILFLPQEEIHQIGMLFYYYHLKLNGKNVIYLGSGIPYDNLSTLTAQFEHINWTTANIIDIPEPDKIQMILNYEQLIKNTNNTISIVGQIWNDNALTNTNNQMYFHKSYETLL